MHNTPAGRVTLGKVWYMFFYPRQVQDSGGEHVTHIVTYAVHVKFKF